MRIEIVKNWASHRGYADRKRDREDADRDRQDRRDHGSEGEEEQHQGERKHPRLGEPGVRGARDPQVRVQGRLARPAQPDVGILLLELGGELRRALAQPREQRLDRRRAGVEAHDDQAAAVLADEQGLFVSSEESTPATPGRLRMPPTIASSAARPSRVFGPGMPCATRRTRSVKGDRNRSSSSVLTAEAWRAGMRAATSSRFSTLREIGMTSAARTHQAATITQR